MLKSTVPVYPGDEMKLQEIITEVFRHKDIPEPFHFTNDLYKNKKEIGGRDIYFTAYKTAGSEDDVWEAEFREHRDGKTTHRKTGSGREFQVFSFITNCIRDVTERYKPAIIELTADVEDENRSSTYQTIIKKQDMIPGYHIGSVHSQGDQDVIRIERDDLDEALDLKKSLGAGILGTALALGGGGALNNYKFEPEGPRAETKLQPNLDILVKAAKKAGLTASDIIHLVSQSAHETANFSSMVEKNGKNYDIKHNPRKARILGNTSPGDGHKYRGRGYIHLTGKSNYNIVTKALGDPSIDLVNNPELAADPDIAARIAIWWMKHKIGPTDNINVTDVTRKINPGLMGLDSRKKYYQHYKKVLAQNL